MCAASAPAIIITMTETFDYIRDPDEIYRRSFALIDDAADLSALPADMRGLAGRLVHACGMADVVDDLVFSGGAAAAGRAALTSGATVLVDAEMVAAGIIRKHLPAANHVICTLNDGLVPGLASSLATTRSAAAIDLWRDRLGDSIVCIGNAPTALFRLLELLGDDWGKPALVLGFPVGFVGAAESKQALVDMAPGLGVPFIALRGRRGGSALAAAAVNALAADDGNVEIKT